jgi:L-fuconolactonase
MELEFKDKHVGCIKMSIVDAHQHFWSISRTDYGWLTPDLGSIYRDFQPDDLRPLLGQAGVNKTILVQAAQSEAETLYLLDIAAKADFVAGVVGWVDLEAKNAAERVAFMAEKSVLGLRPMVQDIVDTDWLLRPALRPAIEAMIAHDLRLDALIQPRHLSVLRTFMATYPALKVVIDHGAKPDIAGGKMHPWADDIMALAKATKIYCKLSGLVTEAAADWKSEDLKPFITVLLDTFGPDRLIWGSDWPVLNLASNYSGWNDLTTEFLSVLSDKERAQIRGGNAAHFYGLDI